MSWSLSASPRGRRRPGSKRTRDHFSIKKRREHNGVGGFHVTDNFVMCNQSQLDKINQKVEKLEMLIKTQ